MILAERVELLPIRAESASRKTAILLVDGEFEHETVSIHHSYAFAGKKA